MRVAYLTLDEVNQHLACTFADQQGVTLDVQAHAEVVRDRQYDAVLYDPDSFPPGDRPSNLTAILACPPDRPIAVHSYDLSADQLHALGQRHVIVARRLRPDVLARLANAVRVVRQQQTVA